MKTRNETERQQQREEEPSKEGKEEVSDTVAKSWRNPEHDTAVGGGVPAVGVARDDQ